MTTAIVYDTDSKGDQREVCRLRTVGGRIVPSNSHPSGMFVLNRYLIDRDGMVRTRDDGDEFLRMMPGAYGGSRLRVGLEVEGTKGDLPGHPFRGNQWGGGQGGLMSPDRDMGSGVAEGDAGMTSVSDHVQSEALKDMEGRASDRLSKMDQERQSSSNQYKNFNSQALLDARHRFVQKIKDLEEYGKANSLTDEMKDRLGKDKGRLEKVNEEIRFRREYYDHLRRKEAARLGRETGKIVMDNEDIARALGKPEDAYIDAGLKPSKGRYPYSPELFKTSDLSGAKVRNYFRLPDGRIAHPDEIHDARKRGRLLVVDKIKVPAVDWMGDISGFPES